ncbi:ankyrin repeat domain-containing protein [bacterium]|jgi:hypothetical protein|nr:ankyrin repeat domain-containing protein [bacterium]
MRLQKIIATFSQPSFSDIERKSFLTAIMKDDNQTAQDMIDANPKIIEARSKTSGYSALHYAAERGHSNVFEILVCHGLDPNEQTITKETPASLARKYNRSEITDILKKLKTNIFDKLGTFSFKGFGLPLNGIDVYQFRGGIHQHLRTIFSSSRVAVIAGSHGDPMSTFVDDAIIKLSVNGAGFVVGLEGTPRVRAAEISTFGEERGVATINGKQCLYGLEDETLFSLTYLRSLKHHSDMQIYLPIDTSKVDKFDYLLANHACAVAGELCREESPIKRAFDNNIESIPMYIKTFLIEGISLGTETLTKYLIKFPPKERNIITKALFESILAETSLFSVNEKHELKEFYNNAMDPSSFEEFKQKYALKQRTEIWVKNILSITENRKENMVILCGHAHQPLLEKLLLKKTGL